MPTKKKTLTPKTQVSAPAEPRSQKVDRLTPLARELLALDIRERLVVRETCGGGQKELWYRPNVTANKDEVPVEWKVKLAGKVLYEGLSANYAVKLYDSMI